MPGEHVNRHLAYITPLAVSSCWGMWWKERTSNRLDQILASPATCMALFRCYEPSKQQSIRIDGPRQQGNYDGEWRGNLGRTRPS
jgi:hypothetical protein